MMDWLYIAIVGLIGFLAWKFGENRKQEKAVNRAKVPEDVARWEPEVTAACREFDVPVPVAMAVMWTESAGDPAALGSANEKGLFQLKRIAVQDLMLKQMGQFTGWQMDPVQNIRAGVAYLRLQRNRTGDWYAAVKAYNQGYQGMFARPERAEDYLQKVREKEPFFT